MKRILVIDDNVIVRKTIVQVLKCEGYEVTSAEDDGREPHAFRNTRSDLIITDIIIPEKDGIETILDIRNQCPAAMIIAISGGSRVGNTDFLRIGRQFGTYEIITKPLDPDHFPTSPEVFKPNKMGAPRGAKIPAMGPSHALGRQTGLASTHRRRDPVSCTMRRGPGVRLVVQYQAQQPRHGTAVWLTSHFVASLCANSQSWAIASWTRQMPRRP